MKILFYTEPQTELTAGFRLSSFYDVNHMAELLTKQYDFIEARLLVGETLHSIISANTEIKIKTPIHTVRNSDLKLFRNYKEAANAWYNNTYTAEQSKTMGEAIRRTLPKGWEPDVVIMHETQAPFLKELWPHVTIIHSMFGATYRAPYPMLTLFDPKGLYGNSLLKDIVEASSEPLTTTESKKLGKIRQWFGRQMIPHDPVWNIIERYQSRFEKLILVPLQVNGYYAFNECSNYETQLEFVEDVLRRAPSDWGVIVTEYGEKNSDLEKETIAILSRKHSNFIYIPELKNIPNVSQALVPHVDAIVTVSSSIGYQGLIYGKAIVSAGVSQIDAISCCGIKDLPDAFNKHDTTRQDAALHALFSRYHHVRKTMIENPVELYALISGFRKRELEGKSGVDLLPEPRDLDDVLADLIKHSQWKEWTNLLKEKKIAVSAHPVLLPAVFTDAISFDLFDTLVNRPFVEPHELFQFIEPIIRNVTGNLYFPFHHLRREAERKARESYFHRQEVTLDEIYAKMQEMTGFSAERIEIMKELEIKAETTMIYPKYGVKRVWDMSKFWGIPRTIITDIYLEEAIIQDVLERNELADYDYLFVSATEKERKEDGTIFPTYISKIKKENLEVVEMLHVGDNAKADGEMARRFGIKTAIIPKAMDHFRRSFMAQRFNGALNKMHANTSLLIGTIANKFYSAPTTSFQNDTLFDGNTRNFGYSALGPFVLGYVQWVIRRVQAEKSTKVFFLARDSYLIMKVYEEIRIKLNLDIPKAEYLYCSRRSVAVPAMAKNKDSVYEFATLNFGTTTVRDFLYFRYGVEAKELPAEIFKKYAIKADGSTQISYPRDMNITIKLLGDLMPFIQKQAEEEADTFGEYLKSIGADSKKENIALVDIGYSGTMQRKMTELTGKKYLGLYMLTHNYVLHHFKDEKFEAWLEAYDDQRVAYNHDFNRYIPLIESLLSSEEGSLVRFVRNEKGELEKDFLYVSNEEDRIDFTRALHAGTMSFVGDYLKNVGDFAMEVELSPMVASHVLFDFADKPTRKDVRIFEEMILENMFAGSEFQVIANAKPFLDKNGHLSKGFFDRLMNESKWKEGAHVALSSYLKEEPAQQYHQPAQHSNPAPVQVQVGTQLTSSQRKWRKLYSNPEYFFSDVKFKPLRVLRYMFGAGFIGRANTSLLRLIISNPEKKAS